MKKNGTLEGVIKDGLAARMNLNCAETMLYAANEVYGFKLPPEALKLAAGFGGGMGVEKSCGAVTGAVMAISTLFVKGRAKVDEHFKEINKELFRRVEEEMKSTDCARLKELYRDEETGCYELIYKIGAIVEDVIDKELALLK